MVDGWAGVAVEILRLKPLIIYHLKNFFLVKTETDREEAMNPGSLGFNTGEPQIQLYFLLGLVYAVVSPILLPFIIIFFGLAYIVYRHQVHLSLWENKLLLDRILCCNRSMPAKFCFYFCVIILQMWKFCATCVFGRNMLLLLVYFMNWIFWWGRNLILCSKSLGDTCSFGKWFIHYFFYAYTYNLGRFRRTVNLKYYNSQVFNL